MGVLVTGGAGYIGSHAVFKLIEKGYDVVVADNFQTGYIQAVNKKAKLYKGDIRDKSFLLDLFNKEKIDSVIHFAASSLVGESMDKPMKYFNNNVYGTQILLETMVECSVKNIVFSSTAAVYGEPKEIPITEDSETNPINTYGETKLIMEKMMKWCSKAHGLNYVSLRYFNVAGAHISGEIGESHNPETHLIPLILQVPLGKREFLNIYGNDYSTNDGTCIRDYIHIEDLIDAHILAMEYLKNGGKSDIFNLGSGNGYSINDMVTSARIVTGHEIPTAIVARRSGDPAVLIASSNKVRNILGWKPKYDNIKDVIESAWKFHKKFPDGFNNGE